MTSIIVVRYSRAKALAYWLFILAVCGLGLPDFLTTQPPGQNLIEYTLSRGPLWTIAIPVGIMCAVFMIFIASVIIGNVLSQDCKAIWINHDELICSSRILFSLQKEKIERFYLGRFRFWPALFARLNDGTRKMMISTVMLRDHPDVILSRLNNWIGEKTLTH